MNDKPKVIESHTLVKLKTDNVTYKGRTVADGRKQCGTVTDEEKASPMVMLESLFLTSIVDAKERRKVATLDIPNAFIQSDMDETVYVAIRGELAALLVIIAPEIYRDYVTDKNGKRYFM